MWESLRSFLQLKGLQEEQLQSLELLFSKWQEEQSSQGKDPAAPSRLSPRPEIIKKHKRTTPMTVLSPQLDEEDAFASAENAPTVYSLPTQEEATAPQPVASSLFSAHSWRPSQKEPTRSMFPSGSSDSEETIPGVYNGRRSASPHTGLSSEQEALQDDPTEVGAAPGVEHHLERYEDLGLLGVGGMGEIRRMFDRHLNRTVAMKLLKAEYLDDPPLVARFLEEAQAIAQLEHPGIIPIYELGRWFDERLYFTMREIKGQTLAQVIEVLHPARQGKTWRSFSPDWNLRRLLNIFERACEAVGYAHERGVVHRDLKPSNIIVGSHGEVQVVDWGLVKRMTPRTPTRHHEPLSPSPKERTSPGLLLGTPRYMAPEQILGPDQVDERSDVYALGVILYEILAGRPPFEGSTVRDVLLQKMQGSPPPPGRTRYVIQGEHSPWKDDPGEEVEIHRLPDGLLEICATAMARQPEERYPNAGALAKVMEGWLDGIQKKRRALDVVKQAKASARKEERLRERAALLHKQAEEMAEVTADWQPEEEKWALWRKQEEALETEQRAEMMRFESIQLLQGALTHEPDLEEAHIALATIYQQEHREAELRKEKSRQMKAEAWLRKHLEALLPNHPKRAMFDAYLQGEGALALETLPEGAQIWHRPQVKHGRRLISQAPEPLSQTPASLSMAHGSHILQLSLEGHASVIYPVLISRGEAWDMCSPGREVPSPVRLPAVDELGPDDCFVPAGWFLYGGDPDVRKEPTSVWVDDFVIRRHPVTNLEYIDFLNHLHLEGREEEALHYVPRERAGSVIETGAMIYGRDEQGFFHLRTDADGDTWQPDWPVVLIPFEAACAYASFLREQTGQLWRLPWELEWEKAARGVDGRLYPWGDEFDPTWCCMRESHQQVPMIRRIHEFPVDESVYGVRGMAGNACDWCLDSFNKVSPINAGERFVPPEAPVTLGAHSRRITRGGHWNAEQPTIRLAARNGYREGMRGATVGFRLLRPY